LTHPSRNIQVFDTSGKPHESMSLPSVFSAPFRPDVIQKVVVALHSRKYQPKGRNLMAGKRTTAESVGVGKDLARVPRVKGDRFPKAGQGAFAPMTVKGRLTHAPSPQRRLAKRINAKERLLALWSAVAATASSDLVASRGHEVKKVVNIPLVVSDEFQKLKTTAEAKSALEGLGLWDDVTRARKGVKVRAGKGRARGRRLKHPRGPLLVVLRDEGIVKAARNLTGVDIVEASSLNVEDLAPGTHPGRLTAWTKSALEFVENRFTIQGN
jgi:large subunit ribosomal protein L4e